MEFHLDRKLRLLTETEYNNLYQWAINELDDSGESRCRDQIPWRWTLYFTATDVVLRDELTLTERSEDGAFLPQEAGISHRRSIQASLRPGRPVDRDNWLRETTYRMFGTDRIIADFRLDILPLATEAETEICQSWGSVSFTSEIDFRNETNEDCVFFYLMVKPSTFERYAREIAQGTAEYIVLNVGRVSGFYSGWSPEISTREVKVLTHGEEHSVEQDADTSLKIPRLGPVGTAKLTVSTRRLQASGPETQKDVDVVKGGSGPENSGGNTMPNISQEIENLLASNKASTRWMIALLIILIIGVWVK